MSYLRQLMDDRRAIAVLAGNLLLILLMIISFNAMVDARSGAVDRAADAGACQQAADVIESFQHQSSGLPMLLNNMEPEITRRIDLARQNTALTAANIHAISPQPPRRLGDSAFTEVSTQIDLVDVPLKQLVSFINALCPPDGGLRLTAFHLSSHSIDMTASASDTWAANLTVATTSAAQKPASESIKP